MMSFNDPIIKDLDNDCPNTMENHLRSGRINVTALYGAFEIPLLNYYLLFRNADIAVLKELVCLCLAHGADVNRAIMDTDDEWSCPLHIIFGYYLGMCLTNDISPRICRSRERKRDILSVIVLLLKNGADPNLVLPDGSSIAKTIEMLRTEPEAAGNIDMVDLDLLCMILGV